MGELLPTPVVNLINQGGLSIGYTSGVDDFDAYIAGSPTLDRSNQSASIWISNGIAAGNVDFDLGGEFAVESIALWNVGENEDSNILGFSLFADMSAAFASPTFLGSFTANPNTGPLDAVLPEVFGFPATAGSFIRMQITSINGDPSFAAAGEVAFEATVVPEPSTFLMLAIGAALAVRLERRRAETRSDSPS